MKFKDLPIEIQEAITEQENGKVIEPDEEFSHTSIKEFEKLAKQKRKEYFTAMEKALFSGTKNYKP